jgi:hypothetical protein
MSGISSIGSSPASSGTSSSLTTNSLPNGGLSSVGASLLSTGAAPDPSSLTAKAAAGSITTYQAEFDTLQQQDTAELLYASFLSPEAGLANADAVLGQAATLLGTPGNPGTLGAAQSTTPASGTTPPATTSTSGSTSSASSALTNLPSVASILAASDNAANQTLTAYANAPVGSSILDYQA